MLPAKHGKRSNIHKAQDLVEFALILPVLLISLFVLIELGRVFHAWMAVENGARLGLRYAVTGELNEGNCNGGGAEGKCHDPMDQKEAFIISIHQAAWAGSSSIMRLKEEQVAEDAPSFFKVTICSPELLVEPRVLVTLILRVRDPSDPTEPPESTEPQMIEGSGKDSLDPSSC